MFISTEVYKDHTRCFHLFLLFHNTFSRRHKCNFFFFFILLLLNIFSPNQAVPKVSSLPVFRRNETFGSIREETFGSIREETPENCGDCGIPENWGRESGDLEEFDRREGKGEFHLGFGNLWRY